MHLSYKKYYFKLKYLFYIFVDFNENNILIITINLIYIFLLIQQDKIT